MDIVMKAKESIFAPASLLRRLPNDRNVLEVLRRSQCRGPVKMDTPISHLSDWLPFMRAEITQRRRRPRAVGAPREGIHAVIPGFLACGIGTGRWACAHAAAAAPFHDRLGPDRSLGDACDPVYRARPGSAERSGPHTDSPGPHGATGPQPAADD
jgi:hypothetical protein